MSQNALVIDAVRLATQFLAPKGTFVTKVMILILFFKSFFFFLVLELGIRFWINFSFVENVVAFVYVWSKSREL